MIRYNGYGHDDPPEDTYTRWFWRIVWIVGGLFVAHLVLLIAPVAHWVDGLPANVTIPRFGGTLPFGWPLRLIQHPGQAGQVFETWVNAILERFP